LSLNEELLGKFSENEFGDLLFSGEVVFKVNAAKLAKVTNLKVEELTTTSAVITFSPSLEDNFSHYEISIGQNLDAPDKTITTTETRLDLTDLSPDQNYDIYVVAVNVRDVKSDVSTVFIHTGYPDIPENPDVSNAQLYVSADEWNGLSVGFAGFVKTDYIEIYINDEYGGNYTNGQYYGKYIDPVPNGTVYLIKAVAVNRHGSSTITASVTY